MLDAHGELELLLRLGLVVGALLLQFAPHLPADPQQQQTAGQQQADQGQKLDRDQGEADAHDDGGGQTDQNGLLALILGQGGGGQAHGDGVVAGEDQVHQQDLAQRRGLTGEFGRREKFHVRSLTPVRPSVSRVARASPHKARRRPHWRRSGSRIRRAWGS